MKKVKIKKVKTVKKGFKKVKNNFQKREKRLKMCFLRIF